MRLTVIGAGYVGLVCAACLAEAGHDVVCMDKDKDRIDALSQGQVPLYEPGLDDILQRNLLNGRLRYTSEMDEAVHIAEVVFLAVGAVEDMDGEAGVAQLMAATRTVGDHLGHHAVVVVKSTVPVGTCDQVQACIDERLKRRGVSFRVWVVSNPEFLSEGTAVNDFQRPQRIVIGCDQPDAYRVMEAVYAPFRRAAERMLHMAPRSAEMTKYACNAMLATRISFMNEMARLAEQMGADIESVRLGMGQDPRIGPEYLRAGIGYGGSCFPKDIQALQRMATDCGQPLAVLRAVDEVNTRQKALLFDKLCAHFGQAGLRRTTIAVWGLAFKPDTDDVRHAPSLELIVALILAGAQVRAFDPVAGPNAIQALKARLPLTLVTNRFALADTPLQAAQGADALALITEWEHFRSPDFGMLAHLLQGRILFDGRNLYEPTRVRAAGLRYEGIGRCLQPSPQHAKPNDPHDRIDPGHLILAR